MPTVYARRRKAEKTLMRLRPALASAISMLVLAQCTPVKAPPPPPDPPTIVSFSADKARVGSGEAVKLSYQVTGATEVVLLDQSGAEIALTGTPDQGEATTHPTRTSFYILRARGDGGRDLAFLQVAVSEPPREVRLR